MTLADKKKWLGALDTNKLERWLTEGPLPTAAATVLGLKPIATINSSDGSNAVIPRRRRQGEGRTMASDPNTSGLGAMLRWDAAEAAREAAKRICSEHVRS